MVECNEQRMLREITEEISSNMPKDQVNYSFWCPKRTNKGELGYLLYFYGGDVLHIYIRNSDKKIGFSLNVHKYEKYFYDRANIYVKTWDKVKNKISVVKSNGSPLDRLERLKSITEEEWKVIFDAYYYRAYIKKSDKDKQYFERARETVIAHNNTGSENDDIKIIEMESKIPGEGKKPDLIAVRKDGEKIILSYIEYKCTTSAMNGNHRPVDHYNDMKKYLKTYYEFYEDYDRLINNPWIESLKNTEREMVFLFSHVGNREGIGMSAQMAYNRLMEVKKKVNEDFKDKMQYERMMSKIKVAIIDDEKSLIKNSDIKSLDDALKNLKTIFPSIK